MSDKDNLLSLLGEWDVPYEERDIPYQPGEENSASYVQVVVGADLQDSGKVTGYPGFFTAFEFDKDGKFLQMGAWE